MSLLLSHNVGNTQQRLIASANSDKTEQRLINTSNKGKMLQLNPAGTSNIHLQLPNVSEINISGDFTQRLRFRIDSLSTSTVLVSKGGGSANDIQWLIDIEGGSIFMWQGIDLGSGSYTTKIIFGPSIQRGKWYEAIAVRDITNKTIKLSINGAAYQTNTWTTGTPVMQTIPAVVGAYYNGTSPMTGLISQYTIWDRPMTISEVASDTTTGLIANYNFDGNADCSNNSALNASVVQNTGQANTGRYVGDFSPYTTTL